MISLDTDILARNLDFPSSGNRYEEFISPNDQSKIKEILRFKEISPNLKDFI